MKKLILKVRVIFTNICRTIYSFLFVNLIVSNGKVLGASFLAEDSMLTCYAGSITPKPLTITYKIFFILIPIALTVIGIFTAVKKYKRNKDNIKKDKTNSL